MQMLYYDYSYNRFVALTLKDYLLTKAIVCNIHIFINTSTHLFGIFCFTTDTRSSSRDQWHDSPSNWKGQPRGWAGSNWKGHVEDEAWRDK